MGRHLKVAVGQYSDKGRKALNQDFHGVCIPREPQLTATLFHMADEALGRKDRLLWADHEASPAAVA